MLIDRWLVQSTPKHFLKVPTLSQFTRMTLQMVLCYGYVRVFVCVCLLAKFLHFQSSSLNVCAFAHVCVFSSRATRA